MHRGNRKRSKQHRFGDSRKKPFAQKEKFRTKFSEDPGERLSESSLGIMEYISDLPGFSGIIKARYSDFHVNEIDSSGVVAKLTDLKVPTAVKCDLVSDNSNDVQNDINNPNKYNTTVLPLETWKEIEEVVKQTDKQVVKIDASSISKEDRTKIYSVVKEKFGSTIIGSTLNESDKKYITFTKFDKSVRSDNRVKWMWPGEWVHFLVHKVNIDTLQAAAELAQGLQIKPGNISYAGTKDRRGKTTQWFCVKKIQPKRIIAASKFAKNITVGNFAFKDHALKLGQLKGNRFRIVLRNVVGDPQIIEKALNSLKINGFINYYGLQRFGSCVEVPTYSIGLALLKSNWKEAVDLILKPRQGESDQFMAQARKEWLDSRNAQAALSNLHHHKSTVEYKLLYGLSRCKENDYVTALEFIPRNMRMLYLHSYQSFLWNKLVSRRIHESGLKPLEGDLIFIDEDEAEPIDDLILIEADADEKECGVDKDGKLENEETISSPEKDKRVQVRPLTKDDINTEKYTITDVVLPLPGFDVLYPSNEIGKWYTDILAKDGLTSESMKNRVKSYSLSGSYRKIISKPLTMSWDFAYYDQPNEDLIVSDVEEIKGVQLIKKSAGKYKALILDFCLNSSTYATMALREMLKGDTSSASQAKLNSYHTNVQDDSDNASNIESLTKDSNISSIDETNHSSTVEVLDTDDNGTNEMKADGDQIENTTESLKRKNEDLEEGTEIKKLKSE